MKQTVATIALSIYIVGVRISFVIALAFGGLGLWTIFKSLRAPEEHIIVETLKGIEMLLLAPLIVSITVGIGRYINAVVPEYSGVQNPQEQSHNLKLPITSITISVLFTELLRRFIDKELDYQGLLCGGGVVILLVWYLLVLRRLRK